MKENRRVDFERLFDAAPGSLMAVAADGPRFTILAATDGYLANVNKKRADIVGKGSSRYTRTARATPPPKPSERRRPHSRGSSTPAPPT